MPRHLVYLATIFTAAIAFGLYQSFTAKQVIAQDEAVEFITGDLSGFTDFATARNAAAVDAALIKIKANWQQSHVGVLIEAWANASSYYGSAEVFGLLREKTGQDFGDDTNDWYQWLWSQEATDPDGYAEFKSTIYRRIDPKFDKYFKGRQNTARIRLDEIRWGGVLQDGIPPLRNPEMLAADKADYLEDDNVVFGIEINGDARAYPKRILAWHEMFTDTIGGVDIAGVYCTLCGTVIPYKTKLNGIQYKLGTSGFLYRSNKLMYDAKTQSLWNTIKGEPVVGPLVDKGIKLEHLSVVTTTWGAWRKRHPKTTVLSLDTGHRRDYGEGVAYREYFSTDRLMFNTPFNDERLENKQEVVALRFAGAPNQQLAIDTAFLTKNILYTNQIGAQKFIILTDASGANRVYDPQDVLFTNYDGDSTLTDKQGVKWQLSESMLTASDGRTLSRLPYHRAFWFGWHATYPETQLIK